MSFQDDYKAYCDTYGVPDRVELMLVDMNGIIRGKWLDGADAAKLDKGEARLPLSTYAPSIFGHEVEASGIGGVIGDPDGILMPIAGTLAPVPWLKGNIAQVLVEMYEDVDTISVLSPREVLARVAKRFAAKGWHPVIASELEFYLIEQRKDASDPPVAPPNLPQAQNYELEIMERQAAVLEDIKDNAAALGLPVDTVIAEYGPGQFEINFKHTDDILAAADWAVIFRRMVRGTAAQHGWQATFAAKPFLEPPGNGMHLHASVIDDDGNNIFDSADDIHPRLKNAIAGSIATMEEAQALFAPHGNSYRRFQPGSFAPTAPNWAEDHRGAGLRIPQSTGPAARMEHRIAGADINPYLAFAAILQGMLDGLEQDLTPPPAMVDPAEDATKGLTPIWENAMDVFEASSFCKSLLGDDLHRVFAAVKRDEIREMNTEIPPLEYAAYIGRI
ncbi:MAG: glutamine synthetase family protein [Pseudomonadota bacterium]